jgi:hypothetical protein
MRMQLLKKVQIICLLAAMVPNLAWRASDSQKPAGDRKKPPREAFEACNGKSEGASVEVTAPHGTLKATCRKMEDQLVAVPEGVPPPPKSGSNSTGQ